MHLKHSKGISTIRRVHKKAYPTCRPCVIREFTHLSRPRYVASVPLNKLLQSSSIITAFNVSKGNFKLKIDKEKPLFSHRNVRIICARVVAAFVGSRVWVLRLTRLHVSLREKECPLFSKAMKKGCQLTE